MGQRNSIQDAADAGADGGDDRRRQPRHKYLIPAEALRIDEATAEVVSHSALHVRDVSRTGVRLISASPWEAGSLMALSWVCPNGQRLLKFCRLRNHKLGNSNWYTLGLSFESAPARLAACTWAMLTEEASRNAAGRSAAA